MVLNNEGVRFFCPDRVVNRYKSHVNPTDTTYGKMIHFSDTDASGVAHFSKLLCLVEEVEHEIMATLGIPVFESDAGWPRVRLSIDFHSSVRFGDRLAVLLVPGRIGSSSLEWKVKMTCGDRLVLDGFYVTVRVGADGEKMTIPDQEKQALMSIAG